MKFIVIFVFWVMIDIVSACAQELSLELSIEWTTERLDLNFIANEESNLVASPLLKLTFRNLTGEDIYFRNVYSNKSVYPKTVFASLTNTKMDLGDRAKAYSNYRDRSYRVEIDEFWEAMGQELDSSTEHEFDIINDDLWAIYTVLNTQQMLNEYKLQKQLSSFGYPDKEVVSYVDARKLISNEKKIADESEISNFHNGSFSESEIKGKYKDQFVFLKAGEAYEQKVSLIGFYLLGGIFEFSVSIDSFPGYVISKEGQKMNLPKFVDGYHLYERCFLKNTVGIKVD